MFEIAGGILLAVAILAALPHIVTLTIWSVSIILFIFFVGITVYFVFTEFTAILMIISLILFALLFYTVIATLFGIVVSQFLFLKKFMFDSELHIRFDNKLSLEKKEDKTIEQHYIEIFKFYQPIGLQALSSFLIASVIGLGIYGLLNSLIRFL